MSPSTWKPAAVPGPSSVEMDSGSYRSLLADDDIARHSISSQPPVTLSQVPHLHQTGRLAGPRNHRCSVVYDVANRRAVRTLPLPVYSVSANGRWAASFSFERLEAMSPGSCQRSNLHSSRQLCTVTRVVCYCAGCYTEYNCFLIRHLACLHTDRRCGCAHAHHRYLTTLWHNRDVSSGASCISTLAPMPDLWSLVSLPRLVQKSCAPNDCPISVPKC